jgi:polyhydroxyalkanoate synthesis repressor PhaR
MPESTRLIKKYPNRRLYDTKTSSYITLTEVKQLVLNHEEFMVQDAKTNEDLTRQILLQIILEEESAGMPMFSADALAQIIRFYGHAMQGMMGMFLTKNIETFVDMQRKLQEQSRAVFGEGKHGNELWSQFMTYQAPAMQGLMSAYIDQTKKMYMHMQDQMSSQTRNLFANFSFPGYAPPGGTAAAPDAKDKS